ncbi:hypothetical protein BDP27DRAFT_1433564 [Rhodocollybia butyracea]|uniref:F-box domain-containing protein n=1 Tax=Rhodocollybia butyracea TaxID=206335 RepID=A0A9P5TWT5_9AGAR|nr:hypothetical protein BDP27DRAFT_1433564 [Rhodocollybia butyracea]
MSEASIQPPLIELSEYELELLYFQKRPKVLEALIQVNEELTRYNIEKSGLDNQLALLNFQRNQLKKHRSRDISLHDVEHGTLKISTLENQIERLLSHRSVWYKHQRTLHSCVYPVNRLPAEILIKIFVFACGDIDLACNPGPLIFGAVCRTWRGVVLSSKTELWSCLRFIIPPTFDIQSVETDNTKRLDKRLNKCVDLYLEKSERHLLTLHITYNGVRTPRAWTRVYSLLEKLIPHSSRWRHLTIDAKSFSPGDIPDLCDAPLPSLESMALFFNDSHPLPLSWLILTSGKLHTITTNLRLSSRGLSTLPSPKQITSLTFGASEELNKLKIVRTRFPNLQHLGLTDASESSSFRVAADSPWDLPITSLEINMSPLGGMSVPLQHDLLEVAMDNLTAPNLSVLTVKVIVPRVHRVDTNLSFLYSFSHIQNFIRRSGCTLTVLALVGLSVSDESIVDLLQHLASLVELTLGDPIEYFDVELTRPVTKELIERLHSGKDDHTCVSSVEPLVPLLESLTLQVRKSGFAFPSFVRTVLSRWVPNAAKIGAELSCLRFVDLLLVEPVEHPSLSELKDAGMQTKLWDDEKFHRLYVFHQDQGVPASAGTPDFLSLE